MGSRVPADITLSEVARRLGMKPDQFRAAMPDLASRNPPFPSPDPVTGLFDPNAVERWRRLRNPHLFPELKAAPVAKSATVVNLEERLAGL